MANIIDTEVEYHAFGFGVEKITTTLTLLELTPGKFGMDYEFQYSGKETGDSKSPAPVAINQNCMVTAETNPTVIYTVANYSDSGTYVSMQITITIDMGILGTKTVFDKTLGGKYGTNNLQAMIARIAQISK
jgi:hypothetical protein